MPNNCKGRAAAHKLGCLNIFLIIEYIGKDPKNFNALYLLQLMTIYMIISVASFEADPRFLCKLFFANNFDRVDFHKLDN